MQVMEKRRTGDSEATQRFGSHFYSKSRESKGRGSVARSQRRILPVELGNGGPVGGKLQGEGQQLNRDRGTLWFFSPSHSPVSLHALQ